MHFPLVLITFVQLLDVLLASALDFLQHVVVPQKHFIDVTMIRQWNGFDSVGFLCLLFLELQK
jgi:hypothetical protein